VQRRSQALNSQSLAHNNNKAAHARTTTMSATHVILSGANGRVSVPAGGFGLPAATASSTSTSGNNVSRRAHGRTDDASTPINADVEGQQQVGLEFPPTGDGSKLGGAVRGPTAGRLSNRRLADVSQSDGSHYLFWGNSILTLLYAAATVAAVILVPLKAAHRQALYTDFKLWDSGSSMWVISPTLLDKIHISWMYVALMGAFALFRLAHLIPMVRKFYDNMVLVFDYNSIRWVFHGVALGGIVAGSALTCGASNLLVFMGIWLTFFGACWNMLFMEETNPRSAGTKGSPRPEVNWLPFTGAAILALGVATAVTCYYAMAVHDGPAHLPWFVTATYVAAGLLCAAVVAVNAFYHFTGFITKYLYLEYVHMILEAVTVLGLVYFQLAGFATA
jgi:hypothetical protein